jgi:hypothetical protein
MVGSTIEDPCFEAGTAVVCPLSGPWGHTAERIALTAPLPRSAANKAGQWSGVWAMQLGDGTHCTFVSGATGAINGMRLNYECDNRLGLYGDPNRGSQPWTIFGGRMNATELTSQPIAIAWY